MEIFKNEILNLKKSATFMLFADNRISLIENAKIFTSMLINEFNTDILTHPDVSYYPELKINDVREIIISSVESPYISDKKIYIIDSIETTKKEPLNALLKVIEEPSPNVFFILLTRRLEILETVKSRSIILNLNLTLNTKLIEENLEMFNFLENNMDYLNMYISKKDRVDLEVYKVESLDEIISSIKNYFDEINVFTVISYQYAIDYLVKNIRFMKEIDIIILKDELLSILLVSNDNKKSRDRIKIFMNTCINKYSKFKNFHYLDELLEYKLSINANVNLKTLMFLFINTLSKN
ncbi:hypothetical protein [Streptobacillus moniliformis]|uniref:hypothetical protein n=1 Tax=Streptobacillus moniliformis TaxID=34105 RepID=UPI0007E49D34|nr:hypothetical protein [Streptobacillus moniliformis]